MLKWVVQFPGHVRLLQPHGMQCIRPPCPSPSPRVCPSSCSLHLWCHPAISSSNFLFSSALNFPQHQGLFQCVIFLHQITKTLKFQLQHKSFQWVVRVDLPQDWLVWSPSCPRDFQESSPTPQFKASIIRCSAFFIVQLSHPYMLTGKTIALTRQTFVVKSSNVSAF